MNVEINTADVKNVGTDHFPSVAGAFSSAAAILEQAQQEHGVTAFWGSSFAASWNKHNEYTVVTAETSARHLKDCGDILEQLAKDHDWTDDDNSLHLDEAYHADKQDEWNQRYE